ncbi:MAG: hypothetical protein ACRDQX_04800, partial [Pseudonocardiaceae bacterium]
KIKSDRPWACVERHVNISSRSWTAPDGSRFFRRLLRGVVSVALFHLVVGCLDSFLVDAVVEFSSDGQAGSGRCPLP